MERTDGTRETGHMPGQVASPPPHAPKHKMVTLVLSTAMRDVLCNTLVLTPFALNVYDVYIVINRGVELKAKAPPSI